MHTCTCTHTHTHAHTHTHTHTHAHMHMHTHSQSSQLVEERQQRLQEYLRFVIVLCTTSSTRRRGKGPSPIHVGPIIKPNVTKASFTEIFPFFKLVCSVTFTHSTHSPTLHTLHTHSHTLSYTPYTPHTPHTLSYTPPCQLASFQGHLIV